MDTSILIDLAFMQVKKRKQEEGLEPYLSHRIFSLYQMSFSLISKISKLDYKLQKINYNTFFHIYYA